MTRAFTIIEILIVVGIMGIIVALGSTGYSSYTKRARDARRKIDMQEIRSALELYRSNNADGAYPSVAEYGTSNSSVLVPIYLKSIIKDPSGTVYKYVTVPGNCDNVTTSCTSYTLSITLETTGLTYSVSANSMN